MSSKSYRSKKSYRRQQLYLNQQLRDRGQCLRWRSQLPVPVVLSDQIVDAVRARLAENVQRASRPWVLQKRGARCPSPLALYASLGDAARSLGLWLSPRDRVMTAVDADPRSSKQIAAAVGLPADGDPRTAKQVAEAVGLPVGTVRYVLQKLCGDGDVVGVVGVGKENRVTRYRAAPRW